MGFRREDGAGPVSPFSMAPQQGVQRDVGQLLGFFLQASEQFLALWRHSLEGGNQFPLKQSQHLWDAEGGYGGPGPRSLAQHSSYLLWAPAQAGLAG